MKLSEDLDQALNERAAAPPRHTWKLSWPGNFCTTCGIDDPHEECMSLDPSCRCVPGPDGEPVGECKVKVPPCVSHGTIQSSSDD